MPDEWEMTAGLNPEDSSDGPLDRNGDGYTNLEEYLNSLVPAEAFELGSTADAAVFESP